MQILHDTSASYEKIVKATDIDDDAVSIGKALLSLGNELKKAKDIYVENVKLEFPYSEEENGLSLIVNYWVDKELREISEQAAQSNDSTDHSRVKYNGDKNNLFMIEISEMDTKNDNVASLIFQKAANELLDLHNFHLIDITYHEYTLDNGIACPLIRLYLKNDKQ